MVASGEMHNAKFSIEEDGEDTTMLSETKSSKAWNRYSVGEAILNRAIFLVVIGLVIIFCLCVAHNGELGSMEWLDEHKSLVAFYAELDSEKQELEPLLNRVHSDDAPLLLVFKSSLRTEAVLQEVFPVIQAYRLNATALVLGVDAVQVDHWRVKAWNLTETFGTMSALKRLVSDFGWAVLFMDTDWNRTITPYMDACLSNAGRDLDATFVRLDCCQQMQATPLQPLVSSSMFLLRPTQNTAALLEGVNKKPGAETFALNAACNVETTRIKAALLGDVRWD